MPATMNPICPKKLHENRNMIEQLDGFITSKPYPSHINLLEKLQKEIVKKNR